MDVFGLRPPGFSLSVERGPEASISRIETSVNVHTFTAYFAILSDSRSAGCSPKECSASRSIRTNLWRQHAAQRTDRPNRDRSNFNLGHFRPLAIAQQSKPMPRYYVFSLGGPGGGNGTAAASINNLGWIAGDAVQPGDLTEHAELWVGAP